MEPDFAQNAAFHDQLAAQYDSHLAANRHNQLARTAFHDLVDRYVAPGSTLFDFGCGTGIDALHYVRKGYRVLAYDNSPGMVQQLAERCATEEGGGSIQSCSFDYGFFPDQLPTWPAPHAIVANFAVLNSIRDLPPLFDTFARLLAPPGWVIVSALNPIHWSKVKMGSWWKNLLPHAGGPRPFMVQPYASYLHSVPELLRAARRFHPVGRGNAGSMVRYDSAGKSQFWGPHNSPGLWRTPAYKLLGHFVFLVWRRDP